MRRPYLEEANPNAPRGRVRHALFDFDGTLSLVRQGWQDVMVPYFVEELRRTPGCEAEGEVVPSVREWVGQLTGKQTIYQCFRLAEEVQARGGSPRTALEYKHEYLARLWERIEHRVAGLKAGAIAPDTLLLPGTRAFLQALVERGVLLYLASGTDLVYVKDEAAALQVASFFGCHIYGALDQYQDFSKQMVIQRILRENALSGPELLVVGDGYVEIENGKAAGGWVLGVASDEAQPGLIDEWKRARLLGAGADAIVPDFSDTSALLGYIFGA